MVLQQLLHARKQAAIEIERTNDVLGTAGVYEGWCFDGPNSLTEMFARRPCCAYKLFGGRPTDARYAQLPALAIEPFSLPTFPEKEPSCFRLEDEVHYFTRSKNPSQEQVALNAWARLRLNFPFLPLRLCCLLSADAGMTMTTLAAPRENLKYTKPWLYYKSGVEFLNDFWPMSPILADDRLLYGPGHVQRMLKRFAEIAEHSVDNRRGRSGNVSSSRRLRSANDVQCSKSSSPEKRRHSSCPTVNSDVVTAPCSVQQLKRKFEHLCASTGAHRESSTNNSASKANSRNISVDRTDKAHSPDQPTYRRRSSETTNATDSSSSSSCYLTDVFGDASYSTNESNASEGVASKYTERKSPKKAISGSKPSMTTTVQEPSPASGLAEMNALLEKFRQSRSRRESMELANGGDPVPTIVVASKSPDTTKRDLAKSTITNECRSPESPDGGATPVSNGQPSTLRPSTPVKCRQILADHHRYSEQDSRFHHVASTCPSSMTEVRQIAFVVASYLSQPGRDASTFHYECPVSESDSDCSSYGPEERDKHYDFDGAYVVPRKSSLISRRDVVKYKSNYVGFSDEPPVAYVYLEETEAEVAGLWQAGQDISIDLYFHIKEQMRQERSSVTDGDCTQ
uniref:Uncharacterized protein n=1 Tax=Trichuris muris TaxID=70415 RepID=A0A5S6QY17_TRIMR